MHISTLALQIGAIVIVLLLISVAAISGLARRQRMARKRKHGRRRHPAWSRVAREHRLREPACAVCGHKGKGLQVHHIRPFHLYPELELDLENLITLCEVKGREHHLLVGHLNEWGSYNIHVREDAKRFHRRSAVQIRKDPHWQKRVQQRP